jgi:hypothetical protein
VCGLTSLPVHVERVARLCAIMIVEEEDIRSVVPFRDENWHGESPLFSSRLAVKLLKVLGGKETEI